MIIPFSKVSDYIIILVLLDGYLLDFTATKSTNLKTTNIKLMMANLYVLIYMKVVIFVL